MDRRAVVRFAVVAVAACAGSVLASTGPALADHVSAGKLDALRVALAKGEDQLGRRQADLDATVATMNARADEYDQVQAQAVDVGEQLIAADQDAAALESLVGGYQTQLHDARAAREAACSPNSPLDTQCEDLRAGEAALVAELRPTLTQARSDLAALNRRRAELFQSLVDLDRQASELIDEIFRLDGTAGLLRDRMGELTDRIIQLEQQIADATHVEAARASL